MLTMSIIYASIVEPYKLKLKYVTIALVGVGTNYVTTIRLILIFCVSWLWFFFILFRFVFLPWATVSATFPSPNALSHDDVFSFSYRSQRDKEIKRERGKTISTAVMAAMSHKILKGRNSREPTLT